MALKIAKKRNREEYMVTKDGDKIFTVFSREDPQVFRVKEHLFDEEGEEDSIVLYPERFSSKEIAFDFIERYLSWETSRNQSSLASA